MLCSLGYNAMQTSFGVVKGTCRKMVLAPCLWLRNNRCNWQGLASNSLPNRHLAHPEDCNCDFHPHTIDLHSWLNPFSFLKHLLASNFPLQIIPCQPIKNTQGDYCKINGLQLGKILFIEFLLDRQRMQHWQGAGAKSPLSNNDGGGWKFT